MDDNNRRVALLAMLGAPVGLAACATAEAAGGHSAHMDALLERLDKVESRAAISEVLFRYARANDRADEAMMRDCFWPESTHKHGRFDGLSADFVGFASRIVTALKFAAHHISNVSIEQNADRAFSECHYFAHHRRTIANSAQEEDAFFEGRYLDFFERRNGVWKIIRRRGQSDYTSTAIPANVPFANWAAGTHSLHAPNDEYYIMRQTFLSGG
jgi:SnoaL-like domain